MMIVFGSGSTEIRKIKEKKEKHRWSVQIMDKLLKRASMYVYDDNEMHPQAHKDTDETTPYKIVDGRAVFMLSESDDESPFPMHQQEAEKHMQKQSLAGDQVAKQMRRCKEAQTQSQTHSVSVQTQKFWRRKTKCISVLYNLVE